MVRTGPPEKDTKGQLFLFTGAFSLRTPGGQNTLFRFCRPAVLLFSGRCSFLYSGYPFRSRLAPFPRDIGGRTAAAGYAKSGICEKMPEKRYPH